jgi:hypothetical protein
VALRDRVAARCVQTDLVALAHAAKIRALAAVLGLVGAHEVGRTGVNGREHQQQLVLLNRVADRDRKLTHDAGNRGHDLVLHLHRLEHYQRRAGAHRLAVQRDRHNHPGEWGSYGHL